ncbi:MAG: phosphate signaling complex protein PhoU [Longimicrobiales bacterium]|nr:phosphate signaling complex protein PhoU [Longimicrobiales bacterium]
MNIDATAKRHFHEELEALQDLLLTMAGHTERAVAAALAAVEENDAKAAADLRAGDDEVDELETLVDERVQQLLALHQPVATDLRLVLTVLKVSNDLERVADHAVNIARAVRRKRKSPPTPELRETGEMGEIAREMLADALAAFAARDAELARRVRRTDDRVDSLRKSLFRVMVSYMLEDPRNIGGGLELLLISQNIERIADLATNIAEDVVFLAEGRAGIRNLKNRADHDVDGGDAD